MRIALIGRTRWLLDTGYLLLEQGHQIVSVATSKAEPFYQCSAHDFELLARAAGADFLGEVKLSDSGVRQRIQASGADLAVSINWPTIVGAEVTSIFPMGVINAHCGDLPKYRGNACPNWAILNGEAQIGLCTHQMAPGDVDAGPIYLRSYFPVSEDTYIGDVYEWLDREVPTLLVRTIDRIVSDNLVAVPQPTDPSLALRCFPRRPEDGRINWCRSVDDVHRLVRASSRPFAGAFSMLMDGRRVTIWRARRFEYGLPFCAVPGQVMLRVDGDPVIACQTGALRLEDIEVEGAAIDEAKAIVGRSLRARLLS